MFGGNETNPLFPVSIDEVRLPYNVNAVQQMQLDVLVGADTDTMRMVGDKNVSLVNLPIKPGRMAPVFGQYKLPVSLHDNFCHEKAGQTRSMLKHIPVSTGLRLSYGEEEHNSSISSAGESTLANLSSFLSQSDNLQSEFARLDDEFDHYIRVQEENIRKGIRELKHRHTISLLNAMEKEVISKLREKDVEINNLNRKNEELAEKIRQIALEAQSWHYRAKHNESLVNVLRSNINQVFLQGAPAACFKEGCGESMADDAVSSSNKNHGLDPFTTLENPFSEKRSVGCKACNGKEVSVLLLPCRHLCLCIDCDALVDICPVCQVKKAGSLQVYLS